MVKRLVLAVFVAAVLSLPAQASATITPLYPQKEATAAESAASALMAEPAQLTSAETPEYAYSEEPFEEENEEGEVTDGPVPSSIGVDNAGLDGFPTNGGSFTILSSGDVDEIARQTKNEEEDTSYKFEKEFPSTSSQRGETAYDWTVLKLNVNVPPGDDCLALDYRFLSEEYPEFVNTEFNDAFIAELDSSSWSMGLEGALTRPLDFASSPAGAPVSVNGVGETAMDEAEAAGTYFDGATGLVTTKTPITTGAHSVYLSILDAGDQIYDSAVFLDNLRLINEGPTTCRPPTGKELAIVAGPAPAPAATAPSNEFSLGPSVKFKGGGTQASFTVTVPGPGTLTAASGATASSSSARMAAVATMAKKGKKKSVLIPASVQAAAAGPVTLTVKLSSAGKSNLKKHGKLSVPVTITFTPTGGSAKGVTKTITFKAPKKHNKK